MDCLINVGISIGAILLGGVVVPTILGQIDWMMQGNRGWWFR